MSKNREYQASVDDQKEWKVDASSSESQAKTSFNQEHMEQLYRMFSNFQSTTGQSSKIMYLLDLSSGRIIGSAKEYEGLYYFDEAQGEISNEDRFVDFELLLSESILNTENTTTFPSHSNMPYTDGHLNSGGDVGKQKNRELLVYSRRPKSKYQDNLTSEAPRESNPDPGGCKPSDTSIEAGKKIVDDGKLVDKGLIQRLVGKLIYLSHTRPDIAFAVSVASQHMHSPKEAHLEAVYKILRLVVVLQEKTYIYDINSLAILDTIDTVPNVKGLCAFSPSLDGCFVALPASTTRGSVLLYNVMELHSHCEIDAHRSPVAAMVLSSKGMYIATASEQGTIIRVHLVSDATKSYSFRRGTYPSNIFSLSFAPSVELPDILVATSSSGSVHAFSLGFALCQRSRRSSIILGSIIPESVSDALDPAHHDVLHNAAPAGVKSYAVVRKVDRVADSSTSEIVACRATISMVTYNGYFQEYNLNINNRDESRRSSIILGSIIPESVSDALDPAHHDVLHNAAPAGVKSYAVVRKVDRVADSSTSEIVACRATISMVTYNGYFQEYNLNINNRDEYSWSLEREFNLLTVIADNSISS
ncbi:hypothetical protein L484_002140 [Morus notabilis]|uniref:Uncharacterized protein n=1 Tax=Morus notabilis TaxID=981085 RepID=W9SA29_9ROSA|nr:hypothetical protein L484_002140 [Morus notabilis]